MNPENSQGALAQLEKAQSTAYNPSDILANRRQELGVNAAQDTVTGLRGAINNTTKLLKQVAPSVMGRTQDSLVTNGQAGKIIQNEQAPIAQNLSEQGVQYNQANEDLGRLEGQAGEQAQAYERGQNDRISYAQNLYNTLYQREQQAEAARQAEIDRQESNRRYNEQVASSRSAAKQQVSPVSPNLVPPSTAPKALSQKRADGGFNFQDPNGQAISAAKYAQLTGQDIMGVLLKMGQEGDKFAAQTYNQLKTKPGSVRPSAIFWGT